MQCIRVIAGGFHWIGPQADSVFQLWNCTIVSKVTVFFDGWVEFAYWRSFIGWSDHWINGATPSSWIIIWFTITDPNFEEIGKSKHKKITFNGFAEEIKTMPRNLDQWFFNIIRTKSLSHQKHLRPSPSIQTANLISCQQFMLMFMKLCSSINHARLWSISKSIIFICFFSVLVSLSFIKGRLHN